MNNNDGFHYQNPRMVVGCIPEWEDRTRACCFAAARIEPRMGCDDLVAGGTTEDNNTLQGAASRTIEEANARVDLGQLSTVSTTSRTSRVYILFRARLLDRGFSAGAETPRRSCSWKTTLGAACFRDRAQHPHALLRRSETGPIRSSHMGTIERQPPARKS